MKRFILLLFCIAGSVSASAGIKEPFEFQCTGSNGIYENMYLSGGYFQNDGETLRVQLISEEGQLVVFHQGTKLKDIKDVRLEIPSKDCSVEYQDSRFGPTFPDEVESIWCHISRRSFPAPAMTPVKVLVNSTDGSQISFLMNDFRMAVHSHLIRRPGLLDGTYKSVDLNVDLRSNIDQRIINGESLAIFKGNNLRCIN